MAVTLISNLQQTADTLPSFHLLMFHPPISYITVGPPVLLVSSHVIGPRACAMRPESYN